jgi:adenylate kinase family enzyme
VRSYLVTGNPGSGKSTLAAELSRRGLIALDADDLAFWVDSAGREVNEPAGADDDWRLAHRWVWSRARILSAITTARSAAGSVFFCGIARNQAEMLDLFDKVFLLVIDEDTQNARLARATSPDRTEAINQQIRDGRTVFQAEMLACGAIPLDGAAAPQIVADRLLSHLETDPTWTNIS